MAVELLELRTHLQDWARRVVQIAGDQMVLAIQDRAPRGQTGHLAASVKVAPVIDSGGDIYSVDVSAGDDNVTYAEYVDQGTNPHPIIGNPLLAFDWPKASGFVFFHHVNHPGTAANPFFSDTTKTQWSPLLQSAADGET